MPCGEATGGGGAAGLPPISISLSWGVFGTAAPLLPCSWGLFSLAQHGLGAAGLRFFPSVWILRQPEVLMEQLHAGPASCCSKYGDQRGEDRGWGELWRGRTAPLGALGCGDGGLEGVLGLS